MDEDCIDWLLSDSSLDETSGIPFSAIVFMLYYGMELKHFLLKISDLTMERYPLKVYDVGRSSVYLCGSSAHGFFLNTNKFPEVKDFDIVSTFKVDVRKECDYDNERTGSALYVSSSENERDRNFCPGDSVLNTTCGSEKPYLNVETWYDTYPGYVILRKCRRHQPSAQTLSDRFVSSKDVMESRLDFWTNTKSYLRQKFDKDWGDEFSESGPLLSILYRYGPAINIYLTDSYYAATSMLNTDLVFALPYPGWPEIADDWWNRHRPSGWPSDEQKLAVKQAGCEIVPTGHCQSPREDFEWKISFSHGEMLLSRSFNRVQREIVHVMKALISELPSYNILNIIYCELELIESKEWTSQKIAQFVFNLVDKYISCVEKKDLPHYFVQMRNLLVRFQQPTIEYKSEYIPTQDYIDVVLLELHEIRRDPLGTLLKQKKNLAMQKELHTLVFEPFVEQIKSKCKLNPMTYVNTLVRLSKAHIYENNIKQAYVYAHDALKLFLRAKCESETGDKTELYLTVAMSSYLYGDVESAIRSLSVLEAMLESTGGLLGSGGLFNFHRKYYIGLYIRLLMIKSYTPSLQGNLFLEKAEMLFSKFTKSLIPDFFTYLEQLNFYLFLGKYDEADSILDTLSFFFLPGFSPKQIESTDSEEQENSGSVDGKDISQSSESFDLDKFIAKHTKESEERNIPRENPGVEILYQREANENDILNHHATSRSSDENINSIENENHDLTSPSVGVPDEKHNRKDSVDSESDVDVKGEKPPKRTSKSEEILYDGQVKTEEENLEDAIKSVEYHLVERCKIAMRYEKIGMKLKAEEIRQSIKDKMIKNYPEGDKLFENTMKYVALEKKSPYDFIFPVPSHWANVFHYNLQHVVYTRQEMPIMDDILTKVLQKADKLIKIPQKVAFMHFLIQRHKMKGDIEKAKEILDKLDTVLEGISGECQLLVGYHYSALGHTDRASLAFQRVKPEDPIQTVQEEFINRIDQLMDIVSRHEIRNEGLNKIFDL